MCIQGCPHAFQCRKPCRSSKSSRGDFSALRRHLSLLCVDDLQVEVALEPLDGVVDLREGHGGEPLQRNGGEGDLKGFIHSD